MMGKQSVNRSVNRRIPHLENNNFIYGTPLPYPALPSDSSCSFHHTKISEFKSPKVPDSTDAHRNLRYADYPSIHENSYEIFGNSEEQPQKVLAEKPLSFYNSPLDNSQIINLHIKEEIQPRTRRKTHRRRNSVNQKAGRKHMNVKGSLSQTKNYLNKLLKFKHVELKKPQDEFVDRLISIIDEHSQHCPKLRAQVTTLRKQYSFLLK